MSQQILNQFTACLVLAVFQAVAAIPWIWALDGRPFRRWITNGTVLGYLAAGTVALAALLTLWLRSFADVADLERFGHYYDSLLHVHLILDFIILAPRALLAVWPKGGAVAFAAYRECLRQPMFWLLAVLAAL